MCICPMEAEREKIVKSLLTLVIPPHRAVTYQYSRASSRGKPQSIYRKV